MHGVAAERVGRDRRGQVRRVVRAAARAPRDEFARAGRARPGRPVRALRLLVAVHRARRGRRSCARWLERLRADARPERSATLGVLVRPHPQNAAQWQRRRPRRARERRGLAARRRPAGRRRRARRLLRLARAQRRRRRHQHERADRGRDPRQERPRLRERPSSPARRTGRCTSGTCCTRTAASCTSATPSTSTSTSSRRPRARRGARGADPALRRVVRPAPGPRLPSRTDPRRRNRRPCCAAAGREAAHAKRSGPARAARPGRRRRRCARKHLRHGAAPTRSSGAAVVTLFFTWPVILRRYEGMVAELAAAGHEVVIASPARKHRPLPKALGLLPGVRGVGYAEVSDENRGRTLGLLRNARDYLWYLTPEQESASFNRRQALDRMLRRATEGAVGSEPAWPDPVIRPGEGARRLLDESLAALDAAIPADPGIVEMIRREKPDVVIVSPLLKQLDHQAEALKAARALRSRRRSLSTAGTTCPTRAASTPSPTAPSSGTSSSSVRRSSCTGSTRTRSRQSGAPHWDRFFAMEPSLDRDEFCARARVRPGRARSSSTSARRRVSAPTSRLSSTAGWMPSAARAACLRRRKRARPRPHPDEKSRWADVAAPARARLAQSAPEPAGPDSLRRAPPLVARGRAEHERADRGEHPRPARLYLRGRRRWRRARTARCTSTTCWQDHGGVVTTPRRSRSTSADLEQAVCGRLSTPTAIRRFSEAVRAAPWPRPAGRADPRRGDRRARAARRQRRLPRQNLQAGWRACAAIPAASSPCAAAPRRSRRSSGRSSTPTLWTRAAASGASAASAASTASPCPPAR